MANPVLLSIPIREIRLASRRDRGATTLELSLVFPIFLTLLFVVIQAGLYFHARNVASTAAQEAAAVASEYGQTQATARALGEGEGQRYMDSQVWQGSGDVNVDFLPGSEVQATAGGKVQSVVPFLDLFPGLSRLSNLEINEESQRPVECFRPQGVDECP